jgi:hypothetical protein
MPRATGPLLSLQAQGTFAHALTFTRHKRRQTVKKFTQPRTPTTPLLVANRVLTKFVTQRWAPMPTAVKALWDPYAAISGLSNYHTYLRHNQRIFQHDYPPELIVHVPRYYHGLTQCEISSNSQPVIHFHVTTPGSKGTPLCALIYLTPDIDTQPNHTHLIYIDTDYKLISTTYHFEFDLAIGPVGDTLLYAQTSHQNYWMSEPVQCVPD